MHRSFLSLLLLLGPALCQADSYERLGEIVPDDVGRKIWSAAVADDVAFATLGYSGVENLLAFDLDGLAPGDPFVTIVEPFYAADFGTISGLFHHGDALYLLTRGGLQVIDISDPHAPVALDNYPVDGRISSVALAGDELIAVGDSRISLFNVAVPTHPVLLDSQDLGIRGLFSVAYRAGFVYIGYLNPEDPSDNSLRVFERTDGEVTLAAIIDDELDAGRVIEHLGVVGDQLVSCATSNVTLWTLANPRRPAPLDVVSRGARICAFDGNHVILNGSAYQVADDRLSETASFAVDAFARDGFPHRGDVSGDLAVLAQGERILVLEAAPPPFLDAGGLSGLWFDPALPGDGFNVVRSGQSTTLLFYGFDSTGDRLWLISETLPGALRVGDPIVLELFRSAGGDFLTPAMPPDALTSWGTLELTFESCDGAAATLTGADGAKTMDLLRLSPLDDTSCRLRN